MPCVKVTKVKNQQLDEPVSPNRLKSWYRLRRGCGHAISAKQRVQVLFQNQQAASQHIVGAMDKILVSNG